MKCHFIEKKKLIIGNYVLFLVPCVLNYFLLIFPISGYSARSLCLKPVLKLKMERRTINLALEIDGGEI